AHGSLYVDGYSGTYTPDKLGFYRVRDTDGDDQFDKVEMLAQLYNRGGSHGPHGLALGPDGMIYHVSGDYARPVDGVSPNSPHKDFKEDLLQPRIWDPSGHARGILAPCGAIQRTDKDGKKWELVAAGFRNPYDLAFNAEGELFTYDADMEYDIGLPWYRPTRVYNVVSGGEYGQRSGSSKWPYYYHDSLPPATDIGLGSPCGLKFGTNSKFPPKYQKALFLCDWAWGHVYAVHLQPQGASYAATFESFASGRPLNAMDIEFGKDGAMYLITGGNDTRTGLYRISYTGSPAGAPRPSAAEVKREQAAAAARALRHKLESFHGRKAPAAVEFAWPHLDSEDRWIRYAARIAVEWQDPLLWQSRALTEKRPRATLTALLALARVGKPEVKHDLLNSLLDISPASLSEAQQLELLRDFGVVFTRLGGPSPELRQKIAKRFDPMYPAKSDALNRELCQLLVFLEAPSVVGKSLALLAGA
ncbi:MAG: heme-binding protein, partial [Pedosphaera parvula]|nr:heme-binding protein [Pedosphaera parvula]